MLQIKNNQSYFLFSFIGYSDESNNSPITAESNLKAVLHRSNEDNEYQFLNHKVCYSFIVDIKTIWECFF